MIVEAPDADSSFIDIENAEKGKAGKEQNCRRSPQLRTRRGGGSRMEVRDVYELKEHSVTVAEGMIHEDHCGWQ